MLKSYLLVALRSLRKQRVYAIVNILGLTIGLACFVLILRFVQFELSYDEFHEKADRTYRVVKQDPGNIYLGTDYFAVTPVPLAPTILADYPEVVEATLIDNATALLSHGDQHFYEDGLMGKQDFFDIFSFTVLQGDPETMLENPDDIVLTESLAEKMFGDTDPIGQAIDYQFFSTQHTYTVAGIVADPPPNAHFTFTYIASILSDPSYKRRAAGEYPWGNNSWYTYIVLQEGADPDVLEAKLKAIVEQHVADADDDPAEWTRYILQPLTDIHLHSNVNFEIQATGSIRYVYLFVAIAIVILLLACFNYMNLAIARSIKRAKEVGMRKVVGARRGQLVVQFIGESVLMAFLALGLALAVVYFLMPTFGQWMERALTFDLFSDASLVWSLLALTAVVGILSGSYPALFMSSLKPNAVLKGTGMKLAGRSRLRSTLVVLQYAASIALVVGSLIIYQQLQYIQTKDMGYTRDQIVVFPLRDNDARAQVSVLKEELLRHSSITQVANGQHLPSRINNQTTLRNWEGSGDEDRLPIYNSGIGVEYLDLFEIPLAAGRNFSLDFASDTLGAYLLNEAAVQAMGWTAEEALGKELTFWRGDGPVVGVLKDFHMHSLHQEIQPLMFFYSPDNAFQIAVKIRGENIPETIAAIEEAFKSITSFPFEYRFFDDAFDQIYKTEMRLGETLGYFTLLALLIASLGLFGLAAFTAEQRTKEIGVRKVLGASLPSLVVLLSKEFTRLVLMAFILAVPVAYFVMDEWLADFAYRVTIGPGVFAVSMLAVLVIAWLSVSYQAFKAAHVNPVDSLQAE